MFKPITALAGPPYTTDDPEPVAYQHWEIYLESLHARTADGWAGNAPMVELNYGAIPDLQLHIMAPFAYHAPRQGPQQFGYSNTELGAKYRLIQETDDSPQVGIFPMLETPIGSINQSLGTSHLQTFLPLWIQKSWGNEGHKWTSYGGGGYTINPGDTNRDYGLFGFVLQRQVRDDIALGGEIFHRMSQQVGDQADTAFNLGSIIDFGECHHLLLSAGRSINGPT